MKRIFKILISCILFFLALGITLHFLLASPKFQQKTLQWITQQLSNSYQANITIDSVVFQPYGKIELLGINVPTPEGASIISVDQIDYSIWSFNIFKKRIKPQHLKVHGLEVNLLRSQEEDTWNYEFLLPSKKKSNSQWKWHLEELEFEFKEVVFNYMDSLTGTHVKLKVPAFNLNTKDFDQQEKSLDLKSIKFFEPDIYVGIFSKSKWALDQENFAPSMNLDLLIKDFRHSLFNQYGWTISLDQLRLEQGTFQLRYEDRPYDDHLFDYRNIEIIGIDLTMNDWKIVDDTITTHIEHLNAEERSGLQIISMESKLSFSPTFAYFDALNLTTSYSQIEGYYHMEYPNFYAFWDFNNAVIMEGLFKKGSKVGWKDLTYFASSLLPVQHNVTSIYGLMRGPVVDLQGKNMEFFDGITHLQTDISIQGLPIVDTTQFYFTDLKLKTNGMGIAYYTLDLLPTSVVQQLSEVEFRGDLIFTEQELDLKGALHSNLGGILLNTSFLNPFDGNTRIIDQSSLEWQQFQIGQVLSNPQDIILNGALSLVPTINEQYELTGELSELRVNQQSIQNIQLTALGKLKNWEGGLNFNNTLGEVKTRLKFDGQEDDYHLNIQQDLHSLQLHRLFPSLESMDATLNGQWAATVFKRGDVLNIDFQTLYLKNAHRSDPYHSLAAYFSHDDKNTFLTISSPDIQFNIEGIWSLSKLKKIPLILHNADWDNSILLDENIDFKAHLVYENTDDLLPDLVKDVHTQGKQTIHFLINSSQQFLQWNSNSPYLQYKGITLKQLYSFGQMAQAQLMSTTQASEVGFYNSEWMKDWKMEAKTQEEYLAIHLTSKGSDQIRDLNAQFLLQKKDQNYFVKLLPSSFKVASETWQFPIINTDHHIKWSAKDFSFNPTLFESEKQRIRIASNQGLMETLHRVDFHQVNLNFLNAFMNSDYQIKGNISGQALYSVIKNQAPILSYKLKSEEVVLNEELLGSFHGAGKIDFKAQHIDFDIHELYGQEHSLSWNGDFYWNALQPLNINLNFTGLPIRWSSLFLKNIIKDYSGNLEGHLALNGTFQKPIWNGVLQGRQLAFTPIVTGVHYKIPIANIQILNNQWEFKDIYIYDKHNHSGVGSGFLKSHDWKKWELSLAAHSDQIQLIDLGIKEQEYYYGDITGKAFMNMDGFFDHLTINLNATPLKDSKLFIPIQDENELQQYSYIQFIEQNALPRNMSNNDQVDFYLQASIDDQLEVTLILDQALKDQITARGNGYIQLSSDGKNPFKMNGTYTIDHGTYDFVFRQLEVINFRRRFLIQSNSVIKWDGDPWNAMLDVKGYALVKARLYDLISSEADRMNLSQQELRDAQTPQSVLVNLELKGLLNNPIFNFNLDLEEGRSLGTLAHQKLQRINQNSRMLINQVGALLLLEQFIPNEGLTNANLASGSINNMSQMVSSAASSQITNFANKVLGMEDLVIGLKYKNYNFTNPSDFQEMAYWNRNEAGIQVRKNFLSNRLMVEVGGSYDWGRAQSERFSNDFMGDFRIQYYLTEDGKIRLNAFRNSQYDVLYGKTVARQGIGIGYKKSFNHLNIFKSKVNSSHFSDSTILVEGIYTPSEGH